MLGRSFLCLFIREDLFNLHIEQTGDFKCQRQAGIITFFFNRVDRLPADLQKPAQLLLRMPLLLAELLETILH